MGFFFFPPSKRLVLHSFPTLFSPPPKLPFDHPFSCLSLPVGFGCCSIPCVLRGSLWLFPSPPSPPSKLFSVHPPPLPSPDQGHLHFQSVHKVSRTQQAPRCCLSRSSANPFLTPPSPPSSNVREGPPSPPFVSISGTVFFFLLGQGQNPPFFGLLSFFFWRPTLFNNL